MASQESRSDDARLILNFIRDYPGVTRMHIAENVRIDRFDIAMAMKQLMRQSAVIRIVSDHFWVRYYPTPRNSVWNSSTHQDIGSKD